MRTIASLIIAIILGTALNTAVANAQDNSQDPEYQQQILQWHKEYVAEKYGATIHPEIEEELPESVVLEEDPVQLIEDPTGNPDMFMEIELLARLIHAEAGNQDLTGKKYVADVVLNRVASPQFPDTIEEVIFQPGQFSVVNNGALEDARKTVTAEDYEAAISELTDQIDYEILFFDCNGYPIYGTPAFKHGGHYFTR